MWMPSTNEISFVFEICLIFQYVEVLYQSEDQQTRQNLKSNVNLSYKFISSQLYLSFLPRWLNLCTPRYSLLWPPPLFSHPCIQRLDPASQNATHPSMGSRGKAFQQASPICNNNQTCELSWNNHAPAINKANWGWERQHEIAKISELAAAATTCLRSSDGNVMLPIIRP